MTRPFNNFELNYRIFDRELTDLEILLLEDWFQTFVLH